MSYTEPILDWDVEIEDGTEYTLLPEGDVDFEVLSFEKGYTKDNTRKGVVRLKVSNGTDTTYITETFVLKESVLWKIAQFLRSVGLKKQGENVRASLLEKSPSLTGRCEIFQDSFTNDKGNLIKTNKVRKYYEPDYKSNADAIVNSINIEDDPWND